MKLPEILASVPWHLVWPLLASVSMPPSSGPRLALKILLVLPVAAWGWFHWKRPERLVPAGDRGLPAALSVAVLALYAGLGMLLYANFSNYDSGDIVLYLSAYHNSTGWLPGEVSLTGRPFLAHHSEFLCIPLGWIYRLAPWPATLLLAQAAAALAAWALFRSWILKRAGDRAFGEWLAFGFALTPCLTGPLLKGFHSVTLAMPFLVLTATAYYDGKWRKFLFALVLLLMVKEVFVVAAIGLGAFALVQRRPAKWVLVPLALGLGYGCFLRFWFFPMMLKDSAYFYDSFFGGWKAALARFGSLTALVYVARLLLSAGSASALRSPYFLMVLPYVVFYLVLGDFTNPRSHYFLEPSFWAFFALVAAALETLRSGKDFPPGRGKWLFSFLATLLLMNMTLLQDLPFYRHHPLEKSYRAALAALPVEATVGLGVALEDHIYKVRRFYWLAYGGHASGKPCTWSGELSLKGIPGEYALLHKGFGSYGFLAEEKERVRSCWPEMAKDTAYGTVWEDADLILIKRR